MRSTEEQANFALVCRLVDQIRDRLDHVAFALLTEEERTLWTVWCLEAELSNGGFDQYFLNDAGDHAHYATQALRRIGAAQSAEIVADALAVFPAPGPSPDRGERFLQLESLSRERKARLGSLTDRFYERPDYLERLLADFAREHARAFPVPEPAQCAPRAEGDAVEKKLARAIHTEAETCAPGWEERVKVLFKELQAYRFSRDRG